MAEGKAKQDMASLKSELSFYKEEYQKYKNKEFRYDDLKEQLLLLKKEHEREKEQLLKEIEWLKTLINEQKAKEEPKQEEKKEVQPIHPLQQPFEESVDELKSRLENVQQQVAREQTKKLRKNIDSANLFLTLQRKMDK
ncbi:hypothetical protein FZC66_15445 [Priestia megaterium]|nr:hypothetical protein FZC66_15445 [Priestia megaterium]